MQSHDTQYIAPLSRLAPPPELDGSLGIFRFGKDGQHRFRNDLEAISGWLNEYQGDTRRVYERVVEQLCCWTYSTLHKPFSSLEAHDFRAYNDFLQNISPGDIWIASKGVRRNNPNWRPFGSAALSLDSRVLIFRILTSLTGWLREQLYCDLRIKIAHRAKWGFNVASPNLRTGPRSTPLDLDKSDIPFILRALTEGQGDLIVKRMIFCLRYFSNLDATQIECARLGDLRQLGSDHVVLRTTTYGSESDILLLEPSLSAILARHGADELHSSDSKVITIMALSNQYPHRQLLDTSTSAWHIKMLFRSAADAAGKVRSDQNAERLSQLKPLCLRNAFQRHLLTISERMLAWRAIDGDFPEVCSNRYPPRPSIDERTAQAASNAFRARWMSNGFAADWWGDSGCALHAPGQAGPQS